MLQRALLLRLGVQVQFLGNQRQRSALRQQGDDRAEEHYIEDHIGVRHTLRLA